MAKKKNGRITYQPIDSFDKLTVLQDMAISQENVSLAIKAEELKGKLAGLYTDRREEDLPDATALEIKVVE
jgi:hypothetical protein